MTTLFEAEVSSGSSSKHFYVAAENLEEASSLAYDAVELRSHYPGEMFVPFKRVTSVKEVASSGRNFIWSKTAFAVVAA